MWRALLVVTCARTSTAWPAQIISGPVCIRGDYPLYSTEALAIAASPLSTAHAMTYSAETAYMPNGMVPGMQMGNASVPCPADTDVTFFFINPPPPSPLEPPEEQEETNRGWDGPNIPAAIGVSIGAGLATGIGGALVFFPEMLKSVPQNTILGVSLAISAGVMIYVSFIEIFVKALDSIVADPAFTEGGATALTTLFFFLGMLACVLLEMLVSRIAGGDDHCPAHASEWNLHGSVGAAHGEAAGARTAAKDGAEGKEGAAPGQIAVTVASGTSGEVDVNSQAEKLRLSRMGIMTAMTIGLHNLPEGLATFIATVNSISSGAALGVAIAIHNVPEGLCVAMPIYYATGNKWKAFGWSLLSGVTEPIGGIAGYAALQPVFTDVVYGCVFAMVGGMMVFIVCHELLPASHRYMNEGNKVTGYLILGMIIMATSLVLFVQ